MFSVHHAVAELGRQMGLDEAELDRSGNLTLIFNGQMNVNFARIDDMALEMWTRLDGLATDARALSQALIANHLGEGTGSARLALTPDGAALILCDRVHVAPLDADALKARLIDFVKYATYWTSPEARANAGAAAGGTLAPSEDSSYAIRI